MKLTDFKNINEFNIRGVNNYGSAAGQRKANQAAGNADAGLSTKETLGKNIFVDKFIQKASAGIDNAIKSGLVQLTPVQPTQQAPGAKTPEQIRKEKQAAAVKSINDKENAPNTGGPGAGAFGQMATQLAKKGEPQPAPTGTSMPTKPYQVPGVGTNPNPTQASPAQPKKPTAKTGPTDQADYAKHDQWVKDQLKKKGIQQESMYSKLDAIFESILNEQSPTVASFVLDAWKAYLHGVNPTSEKLQQAQQLANQVQATYAKDKGQAALRQLGDLAWYASTESAGTPADKEDGDYADAGQEPSPQVAGSGNMRQVYSEVYKLLKTLDKRDRQQVLTAIQTAEEKANI